MTNRAADAAGSPPGKRRYLRFLQFRLRTWFLAVLFFAPWCLEARQFFPDDSLEARLKRPVELRFDKMPLHEALDDLARQSNTAIKLDPIQLAAAGIEPSEPVSINLCDPIPLRTALFLVLRPLGLEQVRSDQGGLRVVVIGLTGEETLVFNVADLADSDAEFENLLTIIKTTVAVDTWRDVGGPGVIARLRDAKFSFVVHNKADACGKIADVLSRARRIRAQRAPQPQQSF